MKWLGLSHRTGVILRSAPGEWKALSRAKRNESVEIRVIRDHFFQARMRSKALAPLHTDLANPTSNVMFRRIGYEMVATLKVAGRSTC